MDYKDTLLMPKTDFEMRGNLTKKEPLILEKWEKMHLYDLMSQQNKDKPYFMLHDGPPYANGNLHMGTAMNRCLKDFVVKSKHMMGYNTPFYPGWDTHGLPIENAMAKLGYDRKKMSVAEFREKCQQYAQSQIDVLIKRYGKETGISEEEAQKNVKAFQKKYEEENHWTYQFQYPVQ